MLRVGFSEADVRVDDGSQWDLHDETLNSADVLLLHSFHGAANFEVGFGGARTQRVRVPWPWY